MLRRGPVEGWRVSCCARRFLLPVMCSARGEVIYVPSVVFGQTVRTLFTVNGEDAVWVQDVRQDQYTSLRYTTFSGQGMMSVYVPVDAFEQTIEWCADSDRTILCDEYGNPTSVTGIQRYMPASVFCPAYLESGDLWWHRAEGLAAYKLGDNYPNSADAVSPYRHDNTWHTDG